VTRSPSARLAARLNRERDWHAAMRQLPGVFIPIRVTNPLNSRRHWRTVWQASKKARAATSGAMFVAEEAIVMSGPATITMTRYGPRALDEGCGLNASLKPVRDGVADHFGVDDADPRFTWVYRQEKAEFFGVRIEISNPAPRCVAGDDGIGGRARAAQPRLAPEPVQRERNGR
jgi:hypothetical protein